MTDEDRPDPPSPHRSLGCGEPVEVRFGEPAGKRADADDIEETFVDRRVAKAGIVTQHGDAEVRLGLDPRLRVAPRHRWRLSAGGRPDVRMDQVELMRLRERQWLEQHAVDDSECDRGQRDPDAEHADDGGGVPGGSPPEASRLTHVGREGSHRGARYQKLSIRILSSSEGCFPAM